MREGGIAVGGKKRDRDRATEAFRRWARAGCPSQVQIREDGTETEKDFRACASVFAMLQKDEAWGRENNASAEIRRAVLEVYMVYPERKMRKCEVTMRVKRLAMERYVSERQVYAWLARARTLWWKVREG